MHFKKFYKKKKDTEIYTPILINLDRVTKIESLDENRLVLDGLIVLGDFGEMVEELSEQKPVEEDPNLKGIQILKGPKDTKFVRVRTFFREI